MSQQLPEPHGKSAQNGTSLARILDRSYEAEDGALGIQDPDEPEKETVASETFCVECEGPQSFS